MNSVITADIAEAHTGMDLWRMVGRVVAVCAVPSAPGDAGHVRGSDLMSSGLLSLRRPGLRHAGRRSCRLCSKKKGPPQQNLWVVSGSGGPKRAHIQR